MDLVPRIYHETQEPDSQMCGQHALNNLLQNRYFQPTDLAEIASQLDDEENATLDEDRQSSMNMDDSGFFSVQVLDRCIQIWNLQLVRWRSEDLADCWDKPEEQSAFVLNCQSHWFTLRRFGQSSSRWYNLNSFCPTPQWISDTYLSMVIKSAEDEGYSVFVIRPLSPQSADSVAAGESILPNTTADEVAARLGPPNQSNASSSTSFRGSGNTLGGASAGGFPDAAGGGDFEDEDAALQRALQASLEDSSPGTPSVQQSTADVEADDPVALSLARAQARLQAFQREQAAALRGDYGGAMDGYLGQAGPTGYAAAVAGVGSGSSSRPGGLGSRGSSRSGNVPLVDSRTEAVAGGSRRARRQGDPSALVPGDDDNLPSAPSGSTSNPTRQRSRHDEDEEQMRRAIEASMREAKQRERAEAREARQANAASGMDVDEGDEEEEDDDEILDDDDDEIETFSASPSPPPGLQQAVAPPQPPAMDPSDFFSDADMGGPGLDDQGRSLLSGDRHLDDEDAELQRALAASMEGIPEGWQIPVSPPPAPKPVARPPPPTANQPATSAGTGGAVQASSGARPPATSTSKSTDDDEEDDSDVEGALEQKEEVLSPDEIRRRRLARFG